MSFSGRLQIISQALSFDGVLSVEQAKCAGLSRSQVQGLVASGVFERPERGVLRLCGSEMTLQQASRIAVLGIGQPVAVSHYTAAVFWELEGLEAHTVEVTVPSSNRGGLRRGVVHRTTKWSASDVRWRNGLPVTTPERTLIDIAARLDEEKLEFALDDALRRGLTTVARVTERSLSLAGYGFPGGGKLVTLLNKRTRDDVLTDSRLEKRFLRIVRHAKIEYPEPQFSINRPDGSLVMRIDFAYPHKMLGIEMDSETWHMDRIRFQADRRKRAQAEAMGWRILAFTHAQIKREPAFVSEILSQALQLDV